MTYDHDPLYLARRILTRCLADLQTITGPLRPVGAILDLQDRLGGREIATLDQDIKRRVAQYETKQLMNKLR